MSPERTWCSEEVKGLTDKAISQMLATAQRDKQFCEVNTNVAPNSEVSKMMNE